MVNKLDYLVEFQEILKDYHISESSEKILANTKLALLVGPSSSGRNAIINELVATGSYRYIISDTTRKPRKNNGVLEQNGVEYWFRAEQEILDDLRDGKLLEAALIHGQQVSGISLRELERIQKAQKIAVSEVEVIGAHNIVQVKPDTCIFFVIPPSFDIWMKRMDARSQMHDIEKKRRLKSAIWEFEAALENDYYIYVVNDTFEHSVERIHKCITKGICDIGLQSFGQKTIEQLLDQTTRYLRAN